MSLDMIQEKLLTYQCKTVLEQENALKEIVQEIALMALARAGFFQVAAFQGGTCLRILYGLERFSEDLDFILKKSDPNFSWNQYIKPMAEEFKAYGFTLEVKSREKLEKSFKTSFLKTDSAAGFLAIKDLRTNKLRLLIKLEIDTHPPEGSRYELKYLDFPLPYGIQTQDLPSLFAGKCHALLCHNYIKGRDWYDFIWYVSKQITINFLFLENAVLQLGPWEGKAIKYFPEWFFTQLKKKIIDINWDEAKQDVARFLRPHALAALDVWSKDFFLSRLEKLRSVHFL